MKNKLVKILILISTIILLFGNTLVFAQNPYEEPYQNPDFYRPDTTKTNSNTFKQKINVILVSIRAVGTICSVIIIAMIGLRYMLGSVEEKAEYKKTALAYLIGAFLLFSATSIPSILYDLGQSIGQEAPTGGNSGGVETDGVVTDQVHERQ